MYIIFDQKVIHMEIAEEQIDDVDLTESTKKRIVEFDFGRIYILTQIAGRLLGKSAQSLDIMLANALTDGLKINLLELTAHLPERVVRVVDGEREFDDIL